MSRPTHNTSAHEHVDLDFADITDVYFSKAKEALAVAGHNPKVTYQVFQRSHAVLAGMQPVTEIFEQALDEALSEDDFEIWALKDGEEMEPQETAMLITGRVQDLVELETIYLGVLARCTRIATNVREVVNAANHKTVLFFPARFDVFQTQPFDGYAAFIGGASGCATPSQAGDNKAVGTMPHALIAAFGGDTAAATLALLAARPQEKVWPLVDFHNDSALTALAVWNALKEKHLEHMMEGVRLDTSASLVDIGVKNVTSPFRGGVTPSLVEHVRRSLDAAGAHKVKICVSGGFDVTKVRMFEDLKVPVDVYAVGEKFLLGSNPFTSDIVARYQDDRMIPCCKVGRGYRPNKRLRRLL